MTTTSSSSSVTSFFSTWLSSLLKLLPTGTVFLYHFLSPVLTNNGTCHPINKILTSILITICGISCAIASFTDSYTDEQGTTHYGLITTSGLKTISDTKKKEQSSSYYKLSVKDFVHAALAMVVFVVVVLLDPNTVQCLFPSLLSTQHTLISVLPAATGGVTAVTAKVLPYSRNGVGYSTTSSSSSSTSSV